MRSPLRLPAAGLVVFLAACTTPNPNYQPLEDGSAGDDRSACKPSCTGRQCGSDSCGGSCGTCQPGFSCDVKAGLCVGGCKPSCGVRQCGPDGCGGSCGDCPPSTFCSALGICESGCVPKCEKRECGPDSCGGECGTCPSPSFCDASQGICVGCAPSCNNRQCGPNGCGGSCGECPTGSQCSPTGQCLPVSTGCGLITNKGCCDGTTLKYCYQNKVVTEDCKLNPQCGWNSSAKYYDCGTGGQAAPGGNPPKTCP